MPCSGIRETAISKLAMASAARPLRPAIFWRTLSHAGSRMTRRFLTLTVFSKGAKSPLVLLLRERARVVHEHRTVGDLLLEVRRLPAYEPMREVADLGGVEFPEILNDVADEVDLLGLEDREVGLPQRDELSQMLTVIAAVRADAGPLLFQVADDEYEALGRGAVLELLIDLA